MTDQQKECADLIIEAINACADYARSGEKLSGELAEFFAENPVSDRKAFLSDIKMATAWQENPDVDLEPPLVCVMDEGWQDWLKDAVSDSWNNGDYGDEINGEIDDFEKVLRETDISKGARISGPMGFTVTIEATDALSLLGNFFDPEIDPEPEKPRSPAPKA